MKNPIYLIEITQKCSFNCKPCFDSVVAAYEQEELKLWEWLIVVDSIAEREGKLIIGGGEPLLREDVVDVVQYAKALGVEVELVTCGLELSHRKVGELKNSGIDGIIIRLDGIDREENDLYRGIPTFNLAVNAIELLKRSNVRCSLMINSGIDGEKLDDAYQLSKKHGVPLFVFSREHRGSQSVVRSHFIKNDQKTVDPKCSIGTVIDAEGRMFEIDGSGTKYSGEVKEKRYRVSNLHVPS